MHPSSLWNSRRIFIRLASSSRSSPLRNRRAGSSSRLCSLLAKKEREEAECPGAETGRWEDQLEPGQWDHFTLNKERNCHAVESGENK